MKKLLHAVLALLVAAGVTGCASTGGYFVDRGRDAKDIFTASCGMGYGAKARVGPVRAGLLIVLEETGGLRGGDFAPFGRKPKLHSQFPSDVDLTVFSFEMAGSDVWPTAGLRGKSFAALGLLGLSGVFCNATNGVVWRQSIPYYTQVELVLGLGSHLRLGFNPGELLDYVLGWTTIDIFKDDLEAKKQGKKAKLVGLETDAPAE